MPNSAPQIHEPSVPELPRSIYDQAQVFVKAEIELLKLEAKSTITKAAVGLVVVMGSGLLLAIALSLVAAAIVLMQGGSAVAALLTAAGVDVFVSVVAVSFLVWMARRGVDTVASEAASATQLTNLPHQGSTLS